MGVYLPKRKYKFEISDSETNRKLTLTLEGDIPSNLAASLIEELSKKFSSPIVESEPSEFEDRLNPPYVDLETLSMREKVELVLLRCFKHGWFTSNDVQEQYINLFKEEVPLSSISTYLSRIYDESKDSMLERSGNRKQYRYRLRMEKVRDKVEAISQLDYLFT